MVRIRFTFSTVTVLLLAVTALSPTRAGAAQAAHTDRIEIYSIDALTLTDQQFLTGAKGGKPARIAGLLCPRPVGVLLLP